MYLMTFDDVLIASHSTSAPRDYQEEQRAVAYPLTNGTHAAFWERVVVFSELMMAKADANGDQQLSFREIDDYVAEVMQSEMMRQAVPGNFGGSMASEAKTEL